MAASYYGVPRTTADVDFIVQVSIDELDNFFDKLALGGLLIDKKRVKTQLASGYNIVSLKHTRFPYQVDLIIQTAGRLERRRGTALGLRSYYQPPEQLVLSKLRMIKATRPAERSFKDREDVKQILANTNVNKRKIRELARKQGTEKIFGDILGESKVALTSVRDKIGQVAISRKDVDREVQDVRAQRAKALLMNERLRRKTPKGSDITKVIRYWRKRRPP
jgi:hypothetical protein